MTDYRKPVTVSVAEHEGRPALVLTCVHGDRVSGEQVEVIPLTPEDALLIGLALAGLGRRQAPTADVS